MAATVPNAIMSETSSTRQCHGEVKLKRTGLTARLSADVVLPVVEAVGEGLPRVLWTSVLKDDTCVQASSTGGDIGGGEVMECNSHPLRGGDSARRGDVLRDVVAARRHGFVERIRIVAGRVDQQMLERRVLRGGVVRAPDSLSGRDKGREGNCAE